MLTINDKNYRNLQEQVLFLTDKIGNLEAEGGVLNEFGIKVVDRIDTVADLPDVYEYIESQESLGRTLEELYGDAIAVGTQAPYTLYIFTRAFSGADTPEWFNIGQFPLAGPQGPQGVQGPVGEQGERGSRWFVQNDNPSLVSGYKLGDSWLNALSGDVYYFNGNSWIREGNIKGTQGIQGVPGPQGIQGIQGPIGLTGPQGPAGQSFTIAGVLSNTNQLPTPTQANRTQAYLVGDDDAGYDMYVIIGVNQLLWFNAGKVEGVKGDQGPRGPQGPQGIQGLNGKDGTSITSVTTGNVIYGDSQTITPINVATSDGNTYSFNVVAQRGQQGLIGPKGDTGLQGPRGAQGPQGIQGPKGDNGVVDYSLVYTKAQVDEKDAALFDNFQNQIEEVDEKLKGKLGFYVSNYSGVGDVVNLNGSRYNGVKSEVDVSYEDDVGITVVSQGNGLLNDTSIIGISYFLPLIDSDTIDFNPQVGLDALEVKLKDSILAQIEANTAKYTKEEVNNLIAQVNQLNIELVETLPDVSAASTHTIYFLLVDAEGPSYDEYILINGAWEKIGTTSTDLQNYYTKEQADQQIQNAKIELQANIEGISEALSNVQETKVSQTSTVNQIYGTSQTGEQTTYTLTSGEDELFRREGIPKYTNGNLYASTPTTADQVANKAYVDQTIAGSTIDNQRISIKDLGTGTYRIKNSIILFPTDYIVSTKINIRPFNTNGNPPDYEDGVPPNNNEYMTITQLSLTSGYMTISRPGFVEVPGDFDYRDDITPGTEHAQYVIGFTITGAVLGDTNPNLPLALDVQMQYPKTYTITGSSGLGTFAGDTDASHTYETQTGFEEFFIECTNYATSKDRFDECVKESELTENYYNKTEVDELIGSGGGSVTFADSDTIVVSNTSDGAKQFNVAANLLNDINRSVKTPVSASASLELLAIEANSTNQTMRAIKAGDGIKLADDGNNLTFSAGLYAGDNITIDYNVTDAGGNKLAKISYSAPQKNYKWTTINTGITGGTTTTLEKKVSAVTKLYCTGTQSSAGGSIQFVTAANVTGPVAEDNYIWKGDDCETGIFVPKPNTRYEIFCFTNSCYYNDATYSKRLVFVQIVMNLGVEP